MMQQTIYEIVRSSDMQKIFKIIFKKKIFVYIFICDKKTDFIHSQNYRLPFTLLSRLSYI